MSQYDTLQNISSLICNKVCVDQQSGHKKIKVKFKFKVVKIFLNKICRFSRKKILFITKNRHKNILQHIKSTYRVNKFITNVQVSIHITPKKFTYDGISQIIFPS